MICVYNIYVICIHIYIYHSYTSTFDIILNETISLFSIDDRCPSVHSPRPYWQATNHQTNNNLPEAATATVPIGIPGKPVSAEQQECQFLAVGSLFFFNFHCSIFSYWLLGHYWVEIGDNNRYRKGCFRLAHQLLQCRIFPMRPVPMGILMDAQADA